jgi:antitoxin component YwqK of YwqJK toxin-antitoxin module
LDDKGNKEAVLRYLNGKYNGRISKWNLAGTLWHEAEYSRGELVQITLKEGELFNPNQIIDLSEDSTKVSQLFEE